MVCGVIMMSLASYRGANTTGHMILKATCSRNDGHRLPAPKPPHKKDKDTGCPIKPGMTAGVILAHAKIQRRSLFLCIGSAGIPCPQDPGACGRGCAPVPQILFGGEDCLSEASSAAQTKGTGVKAPEGPRPGANGFGSFCRNKRTSACGAETPQPLPLVARGRNPAKTTKDAGCPIEPGMTKRVVRARHPASKVKRTHHSQTGQAAPGPGGRFRAPLEIHARSRGARAREGNP